MNEDGGESQYSLEDRNQNPYKNGFFDFYDKEFFIPTFIVSSNLNIGMNGNRMDFPFSSPIAAF